MKYNFNEVHLSGSKSGICPICGKKAKRSTKVYQTLSPFNKNKNGLLKSRDEILQEITVELQDWKDDPVKHARCE